MERKRSGNSPELRTSDERKLPRSQTRKTHGRESLGPRSSARALHRPFTGPEGKRIGEIWFEPPPEQSDLLVKYLFSSEKLSVQVHPGEDSALAGEDSKEECWLVLDAEPGATLAIGFDEAITPEAMRSAAQDGSIEDLLTWHKVKAGDIYHLTPGTVHAIGPGLSLVEVQQNSDTTFRLYDYGRPRELHLDRALDVALGEPFPSHLMGTLEERGTTLIDAKKFRLDRVEGEPDKDLEAAYPAALMVLPLEGHVKSADGLVVASEGECLIAPSLSALDFSAAKLTLLTRSA